jgi:hypothetical protein
MAFAAGAFETSRGVMERALEQRTAKDRDGRGELGREFLSFADGLFSCHQ